MRGWKAAFLEEKRFFFFESEYRLPKILILLIGVEQCVRIFLFAAIKETHPTRAWNRPYAE